ncbi:prepilin-type N-terminal cleavage/methylation domain-containing protein [Variovorax sp. J2P1-59]|uniref:prepilin-type N-terminal cleavage/methylation domain-containing protein n=1 Tax=Variovorax flavidus TaxID=3053501 RepID=UPI0025772F0B|nr:prepilin-type N-terminal cleavage/methylation domain-containing protein [Variovorax sp. J2P1-59]MDM0075147.1 prepilin-type N-terminal cleavage/methylation domain-containing protein [Variovorax sp. J2P1-59]
MLKRMTRPRLAGFTLIEMLVTIVLMSILIALAMPSMSAWMRNARMRTVSDSLQNGLRLAQSEATRRSRQVVFSLTNDKPTAVGHTAVEDGRNWAINTVPAMTDAGETSEFVEAGIMADASTGIQIDGPSAICFSSIGRMVPNSAPGVTGATCALPTGTPPVQAFDITVTGAVAGVDRRLRVLVALGGQVRLCDPDKTLSNDHPDGCP